MIGRIHRKLGTAGFVISIVALVAALGGGAYAAQAGLSGKQKKEVEKIAKKFSGQPGSIGAPGPKGDPGIAGPQGASGDAGSAGQQGIPGERGGEGPAGPTETVLPPGGTLTGNWSFNGKGVASEFVTISFGLRDPVRPQVIWVYEGESDPSCPGTTSEPEALPGKLCIYGKNVANAGNGVNHAPETAGYTADETAGLVMLFPIVAGEEGYGYGSWAVTAKAG